MLLLTGLLVMGAIFLVVALRLAEEDAKGFVVLAAGGIIVGTLMLFGGVKAEKIKTNRALLEACPEQARVAAEREFVCTVPVHVTIKDGEVDGVTYGDKKPASEK